MSIPLVKPGVEKAKVHTPRTGLDTVTEEAIGSRPQHAKWSSRTVFGPADCLTKSPEIRLLTLRIS
jgi:hypothetical protein